MDSCPAYVPNSDWERVPLRGWSGGDDVWLVGRQVATADELALAVPAWDAGAWLRWYGPELRGPLADALEDGRTLLVVRPSLVTDFDMESQAVDLHDLAEPEPLTFAAPAKVEDEVEKKLSFIDIVVVDALGQSRGGVLYELVFPDASVLTGRTEPDGRLRIEGLDQVGDCQLSFPELVAA